MQEQTSQGRTSQKQTWGHAQNDEKHYKTSTCSKLFRSVLSTKCRVYPLKYRSIFISVNILTSIICRPRPSFPVNFGYCVHPHSVGHSTSSYLCPVFFQNHWKCFLNIQEAFASNCKLSEAAQLLLQMSSLLIRFLDLLAEDYHTLDIWIFCIRGLMALAKIGSISKTWFWSTNAKRKNC